MSSRNRVFFVELPDAFPDCAADALLASWLPFVTALGYENGMTGRGVWPAASPRVVEACTAGDGGYLADAVWDYLRSRDESDRRCALMVSPAKGSA